MVDSRIGQEIYKMHLEYIVIPEIKEAIRLLVMSRVCRSQLKKALGFPGGAVVENLPANAGDTGSSPGLGRSHTLRSN